MFRLDEGRYALRLSAVERVLPAMEITAVPAAPEIVLGVVNVQERVVPVIDVRKRFGLRARDLGLSDVFVVARTRKRSVALLVDSVVDVLQRREGKAVAAEAIVPGLTYVDAVLKLQDGIALIHDLDTFLSLEEEHALDRAMAGNGQRQ